MMDQSRPTDWTLCVLADAQIFCLMTGLQESKTRGSTTFLWSVLHGVTYVKGRPSGLVAQLAECSHRKREALSLSPVGARIFSSPVTFDGQCGGAICHKLLKNFHAPAEDQTGDPLIYSRALYHVAIKAGLYRKAVQVYDIPNIYPVTHIILRFHRIIMAICLPIMQFMSIYFRLKTEDIINNLCYGCRLIAHEIVSFSV